MEKLAKIVNLLDNVVTSVSDIKAGEQFVVRKDGREDLYTANHDIPYGHKISVKDIMRDQEIVKYGQPIGIASADIMTGDRVHTHNVTDNYEVK